MNSDLCWWFLKHTGTVLANGYFRFKHTYLKPFPFPNISKTNDIIINKLVNEKMRINNKKDDDINKKINECIYNMYNLSKDDINVISKNL